MDLLILTTNKSLGPRQCLSGSILSTKKISINLNKNFNYINLKYIQINKRPNESEIYCSKYFIINFSAFHIKSIVYGNANLKLNFIKTLMFK